MTKDESLIVDFTQEDDLVSIFPRLPVVSSQAVGWKKIQLAHLHQPSHSIPEHYSPHHIICINVGKPVLVEERVEEHYKKHNSIPGDMGFYPANLRQSFCWHEEVEVWQIYLEPELLNNISYEDLGRDRVEFIPRLSFFDPLIQQMALALKQTLETDGLGSRLYAETMANALAVHLLSRYSTREYVIRQYKKGLSSANLKQVIEYIHAHLERNLSIAELAGVVQLSPHHFARMFKQSTGRSPHQYQIQCRIERAKQLLKQERAIAEVAQIVGFASQGHLNYHFKRIVGMTPKQFLQQ